MRTVPTLAASGAGISLSAVGLALARPDDDESSAPRRRAVSRPPTTDQHSSTMTAVAAYAPQSPLTNLDSPLSHSPSTPRYMRPTSSSRANSEGKERRNTSTAGVNRRHVHTYVPKGSYDAGSGRRLSRRQTARRPGSDEGSPAYVVPPSSQPRSRLRRLSSSVASSRDSSLTAPSPSSSQPSSRPGSMVASKPTSSPAASNPEVDHPPAALPPNRLVKRASSLRSTTGSSFQSSPSSRLPVPVFRRPATSHQRLATAPKRWSDVGPRPSEGQLRQYFTPRVAQGSTGPGRRLSGIPNPIRRVYPDRKYTPMLVSAREPLSKARVEVDGGISEDEDDIRDGSKLLSASVGSSPMPVQPAFYEQDHTARRSFSIEDFLSTGPSQPSWKHTSNTAKRRSASARTGRAERYRVVSAPHASMGSSISSSIGVTEIERPAKRRGLEAAVSTTSQSAHSSSSSVHAANRLGDDDRLDLGSSPVVSFPAYAVSATTETPTRSLGPSPLEPLRHVSGATDVSTTRDPSTVGSDSERRSLGGFSTDYQSDTVWDSLPTHTTRSSSGKRGPPIDTIFDESPPPVLSSGRSTRLRDFLGENNGLNADPSPRYRHSTIEEEGSLLSTPVRSVRDNSVTSTPSAKHTRGPLLFSSSPTRPTMPEPDDIDWDAPDDNPVASFGIGGGNYGSEQFPISLQNKIGFFAFHGESPNDTPGRGTRTVFDWAEQQPSPTHGDQAPPRPKTVHGKKDPDSRGSRAAGRRAPSGMHARSHSVPVVPDVDGKRTNIVANKFGTWGVGTKAVTEDWNEDFDFDDLASQANTILADDKRIDSGHEMFVPPSIRQQQENVVAHIGLLREWGLLIEELKDLRARAVQLDMLNGPYAQTLTEVDGMIELADQESDETTLEASRSPPSSPPGFDHSETEDGPAAKATHTLSAALSPVATRPRKDSEAVARSVIEALQAKRSVSDPTNKSYGPNKKVPFDTATLRHIVPYVNGLKCKIKDGLRKTEGLYYSPRRRSNSPDTFEPTTPKAGTLAFSDIFKGPSAGSSTSRRSTSRRRVARVAHAEPDTGLDQQMERLQMSPN